MTVSSDEFTDCEWWAGRLVARKIADIVQRGRVVISGVISSTELTGSSGTQSFECVLDDGTGEIDLLFLGRRSVAGIVVGSRCIVEGTARMDAGRYVVWNPLYRVETSSE